MDNILTLAISLIYILNLFFIITIIFFERRKNSSTLIWITILSFTHIIGFILYIFFGLNLKKRRFTKKYYKKFIFNRKYFTKDAILDTTFHPQNNLIQLFNVKNHSYLRTKNHVKVYTDGKKLFNDLKESLESAKKYIHMEYFIFENDKIGTEIMDILVKKSKAGIEVKLLYDGMGCIKIPSKFYKQLEDAGGEVLNFFPPFFSRFGLRANYRTHRKVVLVDGEFGFLGGMNIGDEYLGDNKKIGYWRDTHIRIKGSAIISLQKEFFINLDFMRDNKTFFSKKKNYEKENIDDYLHFNKSSSGESDIQIVSSGPDYEEPYIKNGIFKMITKAEKSIYIQTPYLIPDTGVLEALKIATMSGVEVNIMIPNKPDHIFVYWATLSYIGDLVTLGAKCYTYNNGFMHSKVLIIDDEICTIGSTNMDIRSFLLNFEINAFIYDSKVAIELKEAFIKDIEDSTLITKTIYEKRGPLIKIRESVSRLLSPIM
ncbi:MAG: cardiolipin synthase [Psychrilyobacter sp.]|nr:cardiolipin synthase [Psychrilyobacter sp.]